MSLALSCVSPDGRFVACAKDDAVMIRDIASWRQVAALKGHRRTVTAVAFNRDGTRIVTSSQDKTARIWDAASGAEIAVLRGHTKGVNHAAFGPDGARVVTSSSDGTSRVWDSRGGAPMLTLEHCSVARLRVVAMIGAFAGWMNMVIWIYGFILCFPRFGPGVTGLSGGDWLLLLGLLAASLLLYSLGMFYDRSEWDHRAFINADGTRVLTRARRDAVRAWDMTSGRLIGVIDQRSGTPSSLAGTQFAPSVLTAEVVRGDTRAAGSPGGPGNAP